MSGMYGTVKPADINIANDVEIFYHYRPSLNADSSDFKKFKILPSTVLSQCQTGDDENNIPISGLFNLKLPLDKFGQRGVYTIYIRPKEYDAQIDDVGVLAAFPDVRGVVFTHDNLPQQYQTNDALIGCRMEFMEYNEMTGKQEKTGKFVIITSSNRAEAIAGILNNSYEKSIKYRYTGGGSQVFCTVTPSLAPTFNPNNFPNIGKSKQSVKLVNTKFNPIMIELEMVEHDAETISYMLEGDQLIDKDRALVTTFNKRGEIYHQSEYGAYKDKYGNPLYEFKKAKDNVDFSQSLKNIQ